MPRKSFKEKADQGAQIDRFFSDGEDTHAAVNTENIQDTQHVEEAEEVHTTDTKRSKQSTRSVIQP